MDFILAIDEGTHAVTSAIVNQNGELMHTFTAEFPQHYPKAGYVEHSGHEIKKAAEKSVRAVLEKSNIKKEMIKVIGITNQRETVCLFDKNNEPLHPFIVWQCRRTSDYCDDLKRQGMDAFINRVTGLHIDPYFSASKLAWIFKDRPDLKQRAQNGEALFGTIDSFLCHWLSGGALHISDITNASRTMLMDIHSGNYSDECLNLFDIPKTCLPQIVKNTGPYGVTKGLSFLPDNIPIAAMIGDQQASLFGQACFKSGNAKITFGTGAFVLMNLGKELVLSKHGLVSSIAYQINNEAPNYCLEGSAFIAGAAVEFLKDNLSIIKEPKEIDELASQVASSDGVVFVPALVGLGAPHWRPYARGMFAGLSRGTTKQHIARATLEGIALQNADILDAMTKDAFNIVSLKVDGGSSKSDLLMQIQSDILNIPCTRESSTHKTAMGAAYLAGLSIGMFKNLEQIEQFNHVEKTFFPSMPSSMRDTLIASYRKFLAMV